jgi:hypothetical protein
VATADDMPDNPEGNAVGSGPPYVLENDNFYPKISFLSLKSAPFFQY